MSWLTFVLAASAAGTGFGVAVALIRASLRA